MCHRVFVRLRQNTRLFGLLVSLHLQLAPFVQSEWSSLLEQGTELQKLPGDQHRHTPTWHGMYIKENHIPSVLPLSPFVSIPHSVCLVLFLSINQTHECMKHENIRSGRFFCFVLFWELSIIGKENTCSQKHMLLNHKSLASCYILTHMECRLSSKRNMTDICSHVHNILIAGTD